MAWDADVIFKGVEGSLRVHVLSCTADAATQAVVTGLDRINHFSVGPQSITTSSWAMYANSNAVGTAAPGTLGCSGFTSGDVFFVKCYGT